MAHQIFTVSPDLKVVDLEQELYANRITGAPVVDGREVVGVVSRSDIDRLVVHQGSGPAATASFYWQGDLPAGDEPAAPEEPASTAAVEILQDTLVREIMTTGVISVSPEDPISRVARLMHDRRIHRVLVVENGELQGLISSIDLVGVLASAES